MYAQALTWWTVLRLSLEERLVYRGDFALGTFMRFLPIVTQIFLWGAVFAANGDQKIVGYSYRDFVAYYLLTMIARAFSSMPGLSSSIALEIRNGGVKRYLVQPIDMLGFLFLQRIAHKLVYYVVAFVPFAVVFFLCRGFFPGWPSPDVFAAFLLSLVLAFVLGFFLEATMGLLGFWFLEVSSLLFVYMLFTFFCSGHMFPIDMLPGIWKTLVESTPLPYLAYFPAAVFLGKIQGPELARGLIVEVLWVLFFIVVSRLAFYYGVRRYSAFGG